MSSITGALKSRAGQIIFISGHELVRLFQKYWPDFLADEASALSRYLSTAKEKLDSNRELSRLAMLYDIGSHTKTTEVAYVEMRFEAEFSKFTFQQPIECLIPSLTELRRTEHWSKADVGRLRQQFASLKQIRWFVPARPV